MVTEILRSRLPRGRLLRNHLMIHPFHTTIGRGGCPIAATGEVRIHDLVCLITLPADVTSAG
jgi:hypothetical protein